jgi:hypothetical protein
MAPRFHNRKSSREFHEAVAPLSGGCNRKWDSLRKKSKQKRHGFHGFHGFVKKFSIMHWGRSLQFKRIIRQAI